MLDDRPFGAVEIAEKHTWLLADRVRDYCSRRQFEIKRRQDQLLRDLQQLDRQPCQVFRRQTAMTIIHRFNQRIGDAGADADHRRLLDAEPAGDRVGGLEANAADVTREPIRVIGHDPDRIRAIGLVDPHGAGCADAVAVQEDHDLADDLLLGPGRADPLGTNGPDAFDLAHPLRCQPR